MENFNTIVKEAPLDIRLKVHFKLEVLDFMVEMGYMENRSYGEEGSDAEIMSKVDEFANKLTENALDEFKGWIVDGKPSDKISEEILEDVVINLKNGKYDKQFIYDSFAWGERNREIWASLIKKHHPEYYVEGQKQPIQVFTMYRHLNEGFPK